MSDSDDPFGEVPEDMRQFADDLERHSQELHERICGYMDEEEIDENYVAHLLLESAINLRMSAYGVYVENPSVAGLKIDLDRMGRELDEMLRAAKKGAEEYIRLVKEERAKLEAEAETSSDEEAPE
jgi:hypothetical protein